MKERKEKVMRFLKCLGCWFLSFTVTLFVTTFPIEKVYAEMCGKKNDLNYVQKCIQHDKNRHVSKLTDKLERQFNDANVLDMEIDKLTKKDIEEINNGKYTTVTVGYFKVASGTAISVNEKEITPVLEEVDYGNINDELGQNELGIKKAKAKTKENKNENSYLKAIITATEYKDYIYVTSTNIWLTQPKNRYTDAYFVAIERQSKPRFDLDSQQASYTYKYREIKKHTRANKVVYDVKKTKTITPKNSKNIEYLSKRGEADSFVIGAVVNLKNDTYTTEQAYSITKKVISQSCTISGKMLKRKSTYVDLKTGYRHLIKSYAFKDLSFNVSGGTSGVSFGVTYTPNNSNVTSKYVKESNVTINFDRYFCC